MIAQRRLRAFGVLVPFLITVSLWLQQQIFERAVAPLAPSFASRLPVQYIWEHSGSPLPQRASLELVGLAAVQTALLYALFRVLSSPARVRAFDLASIGALGAFVVMLIVDFHAKAVISNDTYAYIGYAKLPNVMAAYDPPRSPFAGDFGAINSVWGLPMLPCVYGPLWVAGMHVALSGIHSLAAAFAAMRAIDALALVLLSGMVFALTRSQALVAIVALNPAIHNLFIADTHNDILGIVLVVAAIISLRRGWLIAGIAAIVAAGLVKITMLVVGAAAVFYQRTPGARIAALAIATVATVAGYWIFSGHMYFHAVSVISAHEDLWAPRQPTFRSDMYTGARVVLVAIALAAVFLLVVVRSVWPGASWGFPALGGHVNPSYTLWALPLALFSAQQVVQFAVALPLVTVFLYYAISLGPHTHGIIVGLAGLIIMAILDALSILRRPVAERRVSVKPAGP